MKFEDFVFESLTGSEADLNITGELDHNGHVYFMCHLCNTIDLLKPDIKIHLREPTHMANAQDLALAKVAGKQALSRMNSITPPAGIIERLGKLPAPWREFVQASAFVYLMDSPDKSVTRYNETKTMLLHYEHQHRLALLELVVWKAACLTNMTTVGDYFAAQQWCRSDWKNEKCVHRNNNAICIVMKSVVPFLGPPEKA